MKFETIEAYNLPERIEAISKYLVSILSVNGTRGEVAVADAIYKLVKSAPYFKEHPRCVWQQALEQDSLKRKNNFALLKKEGTKQTVILHSHMDTVGVEDYGPLKEIAHDSDALQAFFKTYDEDPLIQKHAQSGDWLFGRGILDMKSGDAVNIATIFYYMEHMDELPCNLLLMTNAVEENDHTGAIQASSELLRLRQEGYDFKAAINTDFISPSYEGDEKKYIYTGAAGKMLTCFYIKGRETHVGSCLMGIDATLISSAINLKINTNLDLVETISNEEILPSSALLQRDCKDFYNVQTNKRANLYFNTFLYEKSADAVLQTLLAASKEAVQEVTTNYEERFKLYTERSHIHSNISHDIAVMTFDEYLARLAKKGYDTKMLISSFLGQIKDYDKREVGFQLIDYLEAKTQSDEAKVVVFLAPPFCPHNYTDSDSEVDQALEQMMTEFPEENFVKRRFFPFLSDSSYLAMRETTEDINKLKANFPLMDSIYPLPVDTIRTLDIPAVDLGVYGIGAHTWKERIYKPYSYHTLPKVIRSFIEHLTK
ncbi:peptidase M20 [Streptococcus gallolyticus]|uniref:peptidase M20 n=1 Tax=Streptococcus gallolyticus TaxID=315405 RepID=UPI002284E709|nr:peptidase M20 [Streptococcus gallolyticus]MCY7185498.1 peptidase M20 [Streptococcus gallolyticus subsp. gallolyticus]MCY7189470.1 peptidase M20 [Streptococcus gallolyticus subsp. gallolyticus]